MQGIGGDTCHRVGASFGDRYSSAGSKRSVWSQIRTGLIAFVAVTAVAACSSSPPKQKAKFSPEKYGVKASPRMVASGKPVPKGGGRAIVGKKYKIAGKWYYPKHEPNYKKTGLASWYGPTFHGRKTANGEIFDRNALTAAHTTMPLPSYAKVTNTANGRSMIVRVNDRGPFHGNRIIDLSERVATLLDTKSAGVGKVRVEYVGKAPLHGQDEEYLMASYRGPGAVEPGATRPGTLIAQAGPETVPSVSHVDFGNVAPPSPRPYLTAKTTLASLRPQRATVTTAAYDPALAFEAGGATVRVASNNPIQPVGSATGDGSLGVLRVPSTGEPATLVSGSAISSFTANRRISDAHQLLSSAASSGLSMRQLVAKAGSVE